MRLMPESLNVCRCEFLSLGPWQGIFWRGCRTPQAILAAAAGRAGFRRRLSQSRVLRSLSVTLAPLYAATCGFRRVRRSAGRRLRGNVGQLSRELIFGPLVQIGDARHMMNAVHLWPRRALNSGSGDG
jgi:hypothetical protein